MQKTEAPGMWALGTADMTKIYSQWQRSGKLRDIAKNLLHPEVRDLEIRRAPIEDVIANLYLELM